MLGMPVEKWDQHWAPMHLLCPPCAGFHAVARMETFDDYSRYRWPGSPISWTCPGGMRRGRVQARRSNSSSPTTDSSLLASSKGWSRFTGGSVGTTVYYFRLYFLAHRKDFEIYGYDPRPFLWMAKQPISWETS